MKSFYAVHTRSRCETSECAGLGRIGVEVFLSMLKKMKARRGYHHSTTSLLFPLCHFASFDESIIHAIRGQATDGVIELSEDRFSSGQIVRIKEGPCVSWEPSSKRNWMGAAEWCYF